MAIKGCKTIAEYAFRKWMDAHDFVRGCCSLEISGNNATVSDKLGNRLELVYDGESGEVYVKWD